MLEQFKRLGKHSTVYGMSNVLAASISVVLLPILTRYLTPTEYGALELLVVFAGQLGIVLQLGLGSAVFKFVLQSPRDVYSSRVIATAHYTIAAFALVATAALLSVTGPITAALLGDAQYRVLVAWILVKACCDTIAVVPMARLRIREESLKYGALNVGRLLFSVGVVFLVLTVFDGGLPGVIAALAAESVVFALVVTATAATDLDKHYSVDVLRNLLAFGVPLIPFAFGLMVLGLGDRYFLRLFTSLEEVGRYAVGYKVAAALGITIRAFQVAWPSVLFSAATRPHAERFYARLLTYMVVVLALTGLIVSVFSREFVVLLAGRPFHSAYVVVPFLALAQLSLGVFYITAVGSNLSGKTHYQTAAVAGALLVFIGLNYLLVPVFGMTGAAFATATAYATLAGLSCALSLRLYRIYYEWSRVATALGAAAAFAAVGFGINTGSPVLDIIAKAAVVALYPLLLYLLGFLTVAERRALRAFPSTIRREEVVRQGTASR